MTDLGMNERAWALADRCVARAAELRVAVHTLASGARVLDAGVGRAGRLRRGACARRAVHGRPWPRRARVAHDRRRDVARRAGLDRPSGRVLHGVAVRRAGRSTRRGSSRWARARCARRRGWSRSCSRSSATPRTPPAACSCWRGGRFPPTRWPRGSPARRASRPAALTFAVAPTASLAGGVQIVARVLETGLHKMDTIGFDVKRVVSAIGTAPLPPTARSDLRAIGRTNDCILYGGQARYTVRAEDDELAQLAERLPASALRRLRHAVLRHLQALRQRLLQDRPDALQPRRSVADERDQRTDVSCRAAQPRRAAGLALRLMRRLVRRRSALHLKRLVTALQADATSDASMNVVILSAGSGWHTDELCRALAERGHTGRVLPYERLVARLGSGRGAVRGLSNGQPRDPRCRRRAGADHSERIARADHLSRRRAALDRGARRAGHELAPRDRALGRQVLHDGAAAGGRAADARDRRLRKRVATRWRRCWRWATSSSSRSSARWGTAWCA